LGPMKEGWGKKTGSGNETWFHGEVGPGKIKNSSQKREDSRKKKTTMGVKNGNEGARQKEDRSADQIGRAFGGIREKPGDRGELEGLRVGGSSVGLRRTST